MTIEIKKNADLTIVEIAGRLDTITAPVLDKTIREDLGDAPTPFCRSYQRCAVRTLEIPKTLCLM